jgi:transketolase
MTTTTTTDTRTLDQLCVNTIRTLSMDAVQKANSGHPGTPMALAPIAYVLYTRVMRHSPANPEWSDRDRFVLSCGHASMLLYSMLYLTGYGLELDDLKNFRQLGSPTAGHPEYGDAPGIETTTGPLGQGISNAVGLALAERMLAARFNREGHELVDHYTFAIASDGDLQEGVASEACSLCGHLGLGRMITFYDDNHISIEGDTELSFSEDVGGRFEAYGWHVQNLGEDLELESIERAIAQAKEVADRPSLIIVRTHIAAGSPNKQDTEEAHGSPLGEEEVRLTKEAYGWPSDEPFYVPDEALEHFRACVERGRELEAEWEERAAGYREAHSDLWEEFSRIMERRLPEGWDAEVPRFRPEEGRIATRKASNKVLQWAASKVPNLVGGSADLAPSTLTLIQDGGDVRRGDYSGRNLHFGIREHGMGAIVNGLALHGFKAYGATFLIFSDYMKGAMRLAALMHLPSIFVFTHDSIGLGEDGPTHQPIEQLASLRATPNLYVVRPAGANETALAWRFAIEQTETPIALALSRQGLPVWNPAGVPKDAIHRGAYVLRESYKDPDPDLILIATGSEVHICTAAADLLEAGGIATRVVSMPCVDRFADQDDGYRDQVLPSRCRARVSVEAASIVGWGRWVTEDGESIGMTGFGASAPHDALYDHFGFTPERIADTGKKVVERVAAAARSG